MTIMSKLRKNMVVITQNYSLGHVYGQVYGHALVTVYGEVKEVKLIALT